MRFRIHEAGCTFQDTGFFVGGRLRLSFRLSKSQYIHMNTLCRGKSGMSCRKLEIWRLAKGLVNDIHPMMLNSSSKFELFEDGAQIRRSVKSVKSNIVEGYGR